MEEELKAWVKPQVEEVKPSKPRDSIPITFEVFTFTTPKVKVVEVDKVEKVDSGIEEEISKKRVKKM